MIRATRLSRSRSNSLDSQIINLSKGFAKPRRPVRLLISQNKPKFPERSEVFETRGLKSNMAPGNDVRARVRFRLRGETHATVARTKRIFLPRSVHRSTSNVSERANFARFTEEATESQREGERGERETGKEYKKRVKKERTKAQRTIEHSVRSSAKGSTCLGKHRETAV